MELNTDRLSEKPKKPTNYKVICISLYTEDLQRLDNIVYDLKMRKGMRRVNRSSLIRYALKQIEVEDVPPHVF